MTRIRILLVEQSLDEARFLRDALDEILESPQSGSWIPFEVTHVQELEDARAFLAAGEADLVLLNPALASTTPYNAFITLRSASATIPIVLLLDPAEQSIASRLLRDGAQDYLLRGEIDCAPLARAIRNAIDRQRFVNAYRRNSSFDELTGLFNERGFHNAATRELHLAAGSGQPLLLVLAEIDNLNEISEAYGVEQRELTLLEASDILREAAGNTALLGCLDGRRFVALAWNMRPDQFIGRVQSHLSAQPRPFAFSFGWAVTHPGAVESIDPLLTAAEASLCENEGESSTHPAPSLSTPPTASAKACRA